jgi:hypothetical protein
VNPDSCAAMDRCLIKNHIAAVYPATSEQTNERQSRLQFSWVGCHLKGDLPP